MKLFRDFYTQIGDWVCFCAHAGTARSRRTLMKIVGQVEPIPEDIDEERWLARAEELLHIFDDTPCS